MDNSYQISNKCFRRDYVFIFIISIIFIGSIGLDSIGLEIPIIRQLTGFIFLTFVPGKLLMRILNVPGLSDSESLLYIVGLSISSLMFIGFVLNSLMPAIGISRPISCLPISIFLLAFSLALVALNYRIIHHNYSNLCGFKINYLFNPLVLFLLFIPLFSIFGTFLLNYNNNNILLKVMILSISLVVVMVGFNYISKTIYYPFVIFVIALSLLYHSSLISTYIVEWGDLSIEYWYSHLVVSNSIWNPDIMPTGVNSMLSIVILAPIYSVMLDIDLLWVFKIVFPLLYSLVPVCLFLIYRKFITERYAFFSCFFFMSMFTFYVDMIGINRQQIAELFFTLLIMTWFGDHFDKSKKTLLIVIFSFSLIVSHYGITYVYVFLISFFLIFFNFINIFEKYRKLSSSISFNFSYIILIWVAIFGWYIYISEASLFSSFLLVLKQIGSNLASDFLNTRTTQGLSILVSHPNNFLGLIYKLIHISSQIFITVGLFMSTIHRSKNNHLFSTEYLFLSFVFWIFDILSIVIPYFSSTFNTDRMYHITLLLLSPFCIIGGIFVIELFLRKINFQFNKKLIMSMLSVFLAIYFMFNSGIIHSFLDVPMSFSLDPDSIDRPHFDEEEIQASRWLSNYKDSRLDIFTDLNTAHLTMIMHGYFNPITVNNSTILPIYKNSYLFVSIKNDSVNQIKVSDIRDKRLYYSYLPITKIDTIMESNNILDSNTARVWIT